MFEQGSCPVVTLPARMDNLNVGSSLIETEPPVITSITPLKRPAEPAAACVPMQSTVEIDLTSPTVTDVMQFEKTCNTLQPQNDQQFGEISDDDNPQPSGLHRVDADEE